MLFARWLILLALAGLLSGCFVSAAPLFSPAEADMPLADGAKLTSYSLDQKGARNANAPSHATATREAHSYVFQPEDDEAFRAMFDDIGQGYFVGVLFDEDPRKLLLYGILHKIGKSWFAYSPVCSEFKKLVQTQGKSLDDFHIDARDSNCHFSTYDDLKSALLFISAYSLPTTEYVLEE